MKTSSRLTFWAQGRKRRIYRPKDNPLGPYYVRFQYKGRDTPLSLGTTDAPVALLKARELIDATYREDQEQLLRLRLRKDVASLGEIAEVYRARARSLPDKENLKPRTIAGNIGQLKVLVGRADLDAVKASVLTAELCENFKSEQLAPFLNDPLRLESKRRSVNATLRQARSIFAPDYLSLYSRLVLPSLVKFRAVRPCRVSRQGTRYVPIAQPVIDAMEAEIQTLRGSRPDLYLAFYFMLWLGMRKSEVEAARLEWLETWPNETMMAIVPRHYFKPKGMSGAVALAPSLLRDIRELSGAREPLDYLIPASHPTEREKAMRDLSRLLRRHLGKERRKTCHELRKHAISMVLMRTRSYVDTLKFSRHADVRTLQEHYGSHLGTVAAIESSNWRDEAPVLRVVA